MTTPHPAAVKLLVPVLLLAAATLAGADTIRLTDGRTFADARIVSASPGRVCIRHAGGLVQVERTLLPPELAEKYPADPQAVAAEDARRAADAERQAARDEQRVERTRAEHRAARPLPEPVGPEPEAIRAAAERYARDFFQNKYQAGSNDALTLRVAVNTEDPEPMAGWQDQWRVAGEAAFTHYRSAGWGSFQKDNRRFEVVVYAPAGATPRVKDFTLR